METLRSRSDDVAAPAQRSRLDWSNRVVSQSSRFREWHWNDRSIIGTPQRGHHAGIAKEEAPRKEKEIPAEVLEFVPEGKCVRSAPSGSSPGQGECSNEMLRVLLEDNESLVQFHAAAEVFARADVPPSIFKAFMMANMTALQRWRREALQPGP